MNIIFDLCQQSCPDQAQKKPVSAKDELAQMRSKVDDLQCQVDSLTLAAQALWELLRSEAKLTDAELVEKMQEVDLRDGEADGRITSSLVICPSCARRSRSARRRCVYCGAPLPTHHVLVKS
jgi:hypothetical protein